MEKSYISKNSEIDNFKNIGKNLCPIRVYHPLKIKAIKQINFTPYKYNTSSLMPYMDINDIRHSQK